VALHYVPALLRKTFLTENFMHFSSILLGLAALLLLSGICSTPSLFDVLRTRVEDLSEELFLRASWNDIWLNLIPRGEYPKGAGYVRSSFDIARSEPATDEESWQTIQKLSDNVNGACGLTYNQTYVGEHEVTYSPEMFGLMGPDICQDNLTMDWQSEEFWERYFQALDKRNRRSITNRLGNIYREYCYKASANADFHFTASTPGSTQPPPSAVTMTAFLGGNLPQSELTQEMLDATAIELMEEGADEPNSNGWITQGADGPEFPLYIGSAMSQRLFLNNSELRSDVNQSFQGWKELNPTLKRLGASRILKNFRHVVNRFPARWAFVPNGSTINFTATGLNSTSGTIVTYTNSTGAAVLKRIPTFVQSTASADVTKGQAAVVNGVWRDPSVAAYESVEVLNKWVFREEILMPVNSLPGAKLRPQNYFGEWQFVTGNDAFLGIDGCTGITDPLHKRGRHFAEYRHAARPIFPIYGRMILFKRCSNSFDTITCS